uniref:Methyltransf_11 domain-containing protein n=1 Tax=Globodera pallida TaxID=36090 RepID=A0A183BTW0_GLOPA
MAPPAKKKKANSSVTHCQSLALSQSLITSAAGARRSAGLANKNKTKKIFICGDVWLDIFPFLGHAKVAFEVALLSNRFDLLVDAHFKSKEYSLGRLNIRRTTDKKGAVIVKLVNGKVERRLPIPQDPLPDKVIGFQLITISYVDQNVIEFLQRIRRLFDSKGIILSIGTNIDLNRSWEIIWEKIWPLIKDNICCFHLDAHDFGGFPPTFLCNCSKLRVIHSDYGFPTFPANDSAGASSVQALFKWLYTPRGDGRPKAFLNSTASRNFIICLKLHWHSADIVPFELKNNLTGERLELRSLNSYKCLLVRCPIERDAAKWAKWENEAAGLDWRRQWTRIHINLEDSAIGDGLLEAKEGPSEPKKRKN